ncbi:MAG: DUF234 domain-containing protein [Acholeplasma sp.]|nr:DUF234 domain-containing protein [Acholeplasma sp.]
MDLISKNVPINEPSNSRKTYYEINDNFIMFYYKYIFKYSTQRLFLNSRDFYKEFVEEDFNSKYVPKMFERIAFEYLEIENKQGKINPPLYKIGKYWFDDPVNKVNGEFDLVSEDKNGYIVYEVKYQNKKVTEKTVNIEKEQLEKCNVKYYKMGFFSKNGFDNVDNKKYYLRSLEDLYKIDYIK